jgi:hypothetical protein
MTEQSKAKELEYQEAIKNAQTDAEERLNKMQTDAEVKRAFDAANWIDDADEIVKEGVWLTKLENKYIFKKENGKLLVYDKDNNIVTGGTTSQLTAEQLFESTLKEVKRFKVNNGGQGTQQRQSNAPAGKEMNPAVAAAKEAWLAKARSQGIKI